MARSEIFLGGEILDNRKQVISPLGGGLLAHGGELRVKFSKCALA
jgi:hypothetical protein